MAEPITFVANVGTLSNGLLPLFKVPTGFGGITVLGAQITMLSAGTAGFYLVDAGTAGTSTSGGTIATYGGTAYTAKTPSAMTVNTAYLAAGSYLAVKENNTGAGVVKCHSQNEAAK